MQSHSANGQFLLKNYNRTLRSGIFINNIAIAQCKRPFLLTEVKSHAAIGHFSRQPPVCTLRLDFFCSSCLFARCDWTFFAPAACLHAAIGLLLCRPVCYYCARPIEADTYIRIWLVCGYGRRIVTGKDLTGLKINSIITTICSHPIAERAVSITMHAIGAIREY